VTELKDSEITKAQSLADIHIPKLSAELQVAESIADSLLEKHLKVEGENTKQLERKRQERTTEWDTFVHDMTKKCIRIDNTFKEREEEVRILYKKAEEKIVEPSPESTTSFDPANTAEDSDPTAAIVDNSEISKTTAKQDNS